jgi:hypothetical protein
MTTAELYPLFEIDCTGHLIGAGSDRAVPGGERFHIEYTAGKFEPAKGLEKYFKSIGQDLREERVPLKGEVLSGSDWVLNRSDGALVFDGRLTLGTPQSTVVGRDVADRTQFEEGRHVKAREIVFNTVFSGVAPWRRRRLPAGARGPDLAKGVAVALALRIEASTFAENWASPRFRNLAQNFHPYAALVTVQCLAIGVFKLNGTRAELTLCANAVQAPEEVRKIERPRRAAPGSPAANSFAEGEEPSGLTARAPATGLGVKRAKKNRAAS